MRSRRRAIAFAIAAAACAATAAAIASSYRSQVEAELGELRPVLVATVPLEARRELLPGVLRRAIEVREVPERFAPPDAINAPESLTGLAPTIDVPSGSYVVRSQFATPVRAGPSRPPRSPQGRAVEILVSGAAPLATGGLPRPVDVVVTTEPGPGGGAGRTYVAAEGVRLLALRGGAEPEGPVGLGSVERFTATLDLSRSQALELIQAESFARGVRLIPR